MSQPISRVLSWTVIHLGRALLHTSSNLPVLNAGRACSLELFDSKLKSLKPCGSTL